MIRTTLKEMRLAMMHNLKIRQMHANAAQRPFGSPGFDPSVIDKQIELEERRIMKRRVLCDTCHTYRSTSGSCFC
jgi:hypothetical protein